MTVHVSSAQRIAGMNAMFDGLDGGAIEIRTGAQESTPEASAGGSLLATCALGTPAFGAAAGTPGAAVTKAANPISAGSAAASGTAGHFRLVIAGAAACVMIGDVAASGSDLNLPVAIAQGATVSITSFQLSMAY